jgi:hypothetical protein
MGQLMRALKSWLTIEEVEIKFDDEGDMNGTTEGRVWHELDELAVEREREHDTFQNTRPGMIKRMQFTFSVDPPDSFPATLSSS